MPDTLNLFHLWANTVVLERVTTHIACIHAPGKGYCAKNRGIEIPFQCALVTTDMEQERRPVFAEPLGLQG